MDGFTYEEALLVNRDVISAARKLSDTSSGQMAALCGAECGLAKAAAVDALIKRREAVQTLTACEGCVGVVYPYRTKCLDVKGLMVFVDWRKVDEATRWEMVAFASFGAVGPEQDPPVVSVYVVPDCAAAGSFASFDHTVFWRASFPPDETLEDAVRSSVWHTPSGEVVGLALVGVAIVAAADETP